MYDVSIDPFLATTTNYTNTLAFIFIRFVMFSMQLLHASKNPTNQPSFHSYYIIENIKIVLLEYATVVYYESASIWHFLIPIKCICCLYEFVYEVTQSVRVWSVQLIRHIDYIDLLPYNEDSHWPISHSCQETILFVTLHLQKQLFFNCIFEDMEFIWSYYHWRSTYTVTWLSLTTMSKFCR